MPVLLSGPEYVRFYLEALADTVASEDVTTLRHYDLERPADCEGWADVNVLVTFAQPCSDDDMARASSLRAIITPSLGFEGIDVAAKQTTRATDLI